MRIPSRDVPQADVLADVLKVVEGVHQGKRTFQELSVYIDKVERQGRYYRRAAEILGLIQNQGNRSILTTLGRRYLRANDEQKNQIVAKAVLSSRAIHRVIPFFEGRGESGVSRHELRKFIEEVTQQAGPSMIPRRVSSILNWLQSIGMVKEKNGQYVIQSLPAGVEILEFVPDEPLMPPKHNLEEYQELSRKVGPSQKDVVILIDHAKRERANKSHRLLTDMVASRVRDAGAIPKRNKLIDLSAHISDCDYVFEMKSTTPQNVLKQIRQGISQLYEYRYLYFKQSTTVKLVLVIENPLPGNLEWLSEYLVKDRSILLVWDGDGKALHCSFGLKSELAFIVDG